MNKLKSLLVIIGIIVTLMVFFLYRSVAENFEGLSCSDYVPFKKTPYFDVLKDTIFVSIASYRDIECSDTIRSIYQNAKRPLDVYIGICEQNNKNNPEELCLVQKPAGSGSRWSPEALEAMSNNISIHKLDYTEAKGPTYARYFCSKLWSGQEYYLQIDSHTKFEKDWDSNLIDMLKKCSGGHDGPGTGSKKPVLSAYPPTEEQVHMDGFPVMDRCKIHNGLPIFYASFINEGQDAHNPLRGPIKNPKPFVAAGLMFLESKFLYDIQYDPMLSGLFQGEETLFSARLYTNGYDIYAPNIKVCSHHYARTESPMYYNDMPSFNDCRTLAEKKVKFLLGLADRKTVVAEFLRDHNKYGLGHIRTIEEFWADSGIRNDNGTLSVIDNDSV